MNDLLDHFPIATIIKNIEPVKIQPKVYVRDTKNIVLENFLYDLEINLKSLIYTLIIYPHLNVPIQIFCVMNFLLSSTMY